MRPVASQIEQHMTEILRFLQQRNSAPKLTDPGPSELELEGIYEAALRAPDHAWLRPWRFITITGERRHDFGKLLERCLLLRKPDAEFKLFNDTYGHQAGDDCLVRVAQAMEDTLHRPADLAAPAGG